MLQFLDQGDQQVKGGQLPQIKGGVTVKDLEIEPQMIEANDQVGPLQILDELINLLLRVNRVSVGHGAVNHTDAHAHVADFVPSSHVFSRSLRLQIKIKDILHLRRSAVL